jgi:hypothetical protein
MAEARDRELRSEARASARADHPERDRVPGRAARGARPRFGDPRFAAPTWRSSSTRRHDRAREGRMLTRTNLVANMLQCAGAVPSTTKAGVADQPLPIYHVYR